MVKSEKDNKKSDNNLAKEQKHDDTQRGKKKTFRKFHETKESKFMSSKNKKVSNQDILDQNAFKSTRDAEWFKRTLEKIDEVKKELDAKFLSEDKRAGKLDFIRKLQIKIKDYKDAQKNAELYKKIRFFERRKLERQLTQINKQIEVNKGDPDKVKELDMNKERIIDNINYVKHFPCNYKYYSLFSKSESTADTETKREKIKNKIKIYLNTKANRAKRMFNSKQKEGAIDYEEENDYKDTIAKDDFFIIND